MALENTRARALRVLASGQRSPPGKCAEAFRFEERGRRALLLKRGAPQGRAREF
jgi:hypothetical protein